MKDAVAARNEVVQSSHPPIFQQGTLQTRDPNHGNKANQEFPPYGLPLNYESIYEDYVEQKTTPLVVNAEFTQVPSVSHVEKVIINKIHSTTQP